MGKQIRLLEKLTYAVISHPWLKIIALALAVMIWFYVNGEINRFNY